MYRQYLLHNILAISDTNPHIFGDGSDVSRILFLVARDSKQKIFLCKKWEQDNLQLRAVHKLYALFFIACSSQLLMNNVQQTDSIHFNKQQNQIKHFSIVPFNLTIQHKPKPNTIR